MTTESHPITEVIDVAFTDIPYSDPDGISEDLLAARVRTREAVDEETGDQWSLADILIAAEVGETTVNTRSAGLSRITLSGAELCFEYVPADGSITPSGEMSSDLDLAGLFMHGLELTTRAYQQPREQRHHQP